MPNSAPIAVPGLRRNMVTICAMTATIMQALDTTIANVALPYMQGTLSASQDQINWVLTSYIVAAAIMTAPVGWIANASAARRICILCSGGFTDPNVISAGCKSLMRSTQPQPFSVPTSRSTSVGRCAHEVARAWPLPIRLREPDSAYPRLQLRMKPSHSPSVQASVFSIGSPCA